MKKLDRSSVIEPSCLSKYKYGLHQWGILSRNKVENQEIWDSLLPLQSSNCAYCEASLHHHKHIEHFFQRNTNGYEHLTFIWDNIFGSCCNSNTCGKYKDEKFKGDLKKIIKPDIDNPNDYFIFLKNGNIQIKAGLSENDRSKAELTLSAFNLNSDSNLVNRRETALKSFFSEVNEIYSLLEDMNYENYVKELIEEKKLEVSSLEFSTALIHLFQYNRSF
ncbi:retron Ec78 anti-phage system effector HNH endonuclease PtuB [Acinetobacter johnsonii]|uniref:retron Ec78 anti-phage system effector HNH endonuclease PtuB n=1 Tax=Acinetobacter johnsonii TaxID=40214 RepID=UPI001F457C20|nr:retron Ec78 anti-phage system effector HNH endonuclease PtuB [Acinetobacter johnsonii]UIP95945.1 TIGR02646 family protein [Acinetobacter johnsonii]